MSQLADVHDAQFEDLLEVLHRTRGFDFTGYKRASLMRRVRRRMADVGIETFHECSDHLELHAEEFTALFDTLLINVAGFFRDAAAWTTLRKRVIPAIVDGTDGWGTSADGARAVPRARRCRPSCWVRSPVAETTLRDSSLSRRGTCRLQPLSRKCRLISPSMVGIA